MQAEIQSVKSSRSLTPKLYTYLVGPAALTNDLPFGGLAASFNLAFAGLTDVAPKELEPSMRLGR